MVHLTGQDVHITPDVLDITLSMDENTLDYHYSIVQDVSLTSDYKIKRGWYITELEEGLRVNLAMKAIKHLENNPNLSEETLIYQLKDYIKSRPPFLLDIEHQLLEDLAVNLN